MAAPRLVYVHGAGPQEQQDLLKRRLDEHLFGANQLDRTVLAYYSDLLHEVPPMPAAFEGAAAAGADAAEAAALTAMFFARADEVATAAATGGTGVPGAFEGVTLPDPIFRIVARVASSDVIAYLFGDLRDAIRDRVRAALPAGEPLVVLAHSLGTVVAFDVLSELADRDVRLFVTVGSPLGIGNVQRRIGDHTGPPARIPACVAVWRNFADPFDPVALEQTLADEFTPGGFVVDEKVENAAFLNHDLTGYLDAPAVGDALRAAVAAGG